MALTYDLELNEVGVGVTSVTDIATSDYALTGLNSESDYQVRVRSVETITGVEYPSLWSAWVDFTTLVTLADIVAALGTITNSQTIHAATTRITVPETVVESYDLELTEEGQSPVVITDIATNSHTLTGLTADTNYSVRVRHVKTVNGGVMQSLWSGATAFTATASLSDIVAVLGTIANNQTLHSVSTSVVSLPDVVAELGSISNTQTVHPVTTSVNDPLAPVVAQLGTLTNAQTLHPISVLTPVVAQLSTITNDQTVHAISTTTTEAQAATHWVIQLIDLSDMSVMDSQILFTSNYSATGLSANVVGDNKYRLSVVGISDLGGKSAPLNIDFSTIPLAVSDSATFSASSEQALDQFYIDATFMYDQSIDTAIIFGSVNQAFDTITATFDSSPYALTVDDLQFTGESLAVDPVIAAPQALEFSYYDDTSGLFTIDVGSSGDRLEL